MKAKELKALLDRCDDDFEILLEAHNEHCPSIYGVGYTHLSDSPDVIRYCLSHDKREGVTGILTLGHW